MEEEKQTAGAGAAAQSDFSQGTVPSNILRLAMPMVVAQLINVLYSVVDRMYIGHLPAAAGNALTGVGVTFPILTVVIAFANLFGAGGAPLFSICLLYTSFSSILPAAMQEEIRRI